MSALHSTPRDRSSQQPDEIRDMSGEDTVLAGNSVVVRRRAGLAALVGAAASAVAIAYLWRATQSMLPLDWALCAAMALVAGYFLTTLVDARNPLAVADDLGVRLRLGDEWRGLPWEAIGRVEVHSRRGPLRDGRLVFVPHSLARAVEGIEGKAKRHARLNQKVYGAVLAVPIGFTTRVVVAGPDSDAGMVEQLTTLSRDAASVVEVGPAPARESAPGSAPGSAPASETEPATGQPPVPAAGPEEGEARTEEARNEPSRNDDRAAVEHREAQPADVPANIEDAVADDGRRERVARRRMLGGIGLIVSRVRKSRHDDAVDDGTPSLPDDASSLGLLRASPRLLRTSDVEEAPLRVTQRARRAQVTRDVPATAAVAAPVPPHSDAEAGLDTGGDSGVGTGTATGPAPEGVRLVSPLVNSGLVPTSRVRPIARLGEPVEPLVIDDFVTEPAYDPVIGPEVMAARNRLGLSVDELADRTRIRPHVIEAIEVDDFTPCGGDFYARGHLRTLARVLGEDADPLLAAFESRYATAPVNARRVFEAELATGLRDNMRSGQGGPNWGLLVGVVLCLLLVWGVVRFFSAEPTDLVQNPIPALDGSASHNREPDPRPGPAAARPVPVTLVALGSGTQVVVRNSDGRIAFRGQLAPGARERLRADPPLRVRATDAAAVRVLVRGERRGDLGQPGQAGSRTFR